MASVLHDYIEMYPQVARGCLHDLVGSALDDQSLPPEFESRCVGIPEGSFIFDFASLPLEVAQPL